jgi:hypothetical protein
MDTIRSLVERIEVGRPNEELSPCTVTSVGALASVLAFVSEQDELAGRQSAAKQNGGPVQDGRSLELVAGQNTTKNVWRKRRSA